MGRESQVNEFDLKEVIVEVMVEGSVEGMVELNGNWV